MEKFYRKFENFPNINSHWGVDCSPSFANFPGFGGGGGVPPAPPPGAATAYYHIYYWLFQMRHFQYFLHQLGESTLCTSTQKLRRWRWNWKTSSSKRVQRVKCELVTHTLFITNLTCSFFAFLCFPYFLH